MDLRNTDMSGMRELAGLKPLTEEQQIEANGTEGVIKALAETDYRDKDAYFKMVQLLKGLAVASEKDKAAKAYMDKVSDALTRLGGGGKTEEIEELDEDADSFNAIRAKGGVSFMKAAAEGFKAGDTADGAKNMIHVLNSVRAIFQKLSKAQPRFKQTSDLLKKSRDSAEAAYDAILGEDVNGVSSPTGNTIGEMMGSGIELDTKAMVKNVDGIVKHAASAAKDLAKGKNRMAIASLTDIVSNIQRVYTELERKHGILSEPRYSLRKAVMEMDRTARQTAEK